MNGHSFAPTSIRSVLLLLELMHHLSVTHLLLTVSTLQLIECQSGDCISVQHIHQVIGSFLKEDMRVEDLAYAPIVSYFDGVFSSTDNFREMIHVRTFLLL